MHFHIKLRLQWLKRSSRLLSSPEWLQVYWNVSIENATLDRFIDSRIGKIRFMIYELYQVASHLACLVDSLGTFVIYYRTSVASNNSMWRIQRNQNFISCFKPLTVGGTRINLSIKDVFKMSKWLIMNWKPKIAVLINHILRDKPL